MVDSGKITPTAAAKFIVGLTSQEKAELLEYLSENDDSVKKFTETQIAQYIEAIQTCETKIKDFQELSTGNNDDYLRIVEEKRAHEGRGYEVSFGVNAFATRTQGSQEGTCRSQEARKSCMIM